MTRRNEISSRMLFMGLLCSIMSFVTFVPTTIADEGSPSDQQPAMNLDGVESKPPSDEALASDTQAASETPDAGVATEPVVPLPSPVELFGENLGKIDLINDGTMYSWRLANAKSEDVIETVKGIFDKAIKDERINIVENKARNLIIACFPDLKDPGLRKQWAQVMSSIDKVGEQAMIEAIIVELVLNDIGQWGANLKSLADSVIGGNEIFQMISMSHKASSIEVEEAGIEGFKYYVTSGNKLKALLFAGQTTNKVRVLSSPHLVVSNHKPAVFKLGRTLPIMTGSTTANGVTTYSFQEKEIGINITLTPHFDTLGRINLDINQEVNDLLSYDADKKVADFAHKTLTSNITLRSGETVALGGYIQSSNRLNRKRIPGLSNIPFLGKFINRDTNTSEKVEVIVFLTPKVLKDNRGIDIKKIANQDLFRSKERITSKLDSHFDNSHAGARRNAKLEKQIARETAKRQISGRSPETPGPGKVASSAESAPSTVMAPAVTPTPAIDSVRATGSSTASLDTLVSEIRSQMLHNRKEP